MIKLNTQHSWEQTHFTLSVNLSVVDSVTDTQTPEHNMNEDELMSSEQKQLDCDVSINYFTVTV